MEEMETEEKYFCHEEEDLDAEDYDFEDPSFSEIDDD